MPGQNYSLSKRAREGSAEVTNEICAIASSISHHWSDTVEYVHCQASFKALESGLVHFYTVHSFMI